MNVKNTSKEQKEVDSVKTVKKDIIQKKVNVSNVLINVLIV